MPKTTAGLLLSTLSGDGEAELALLQCAAPLVKHYANRAPIPDREDLSQELTICVLMAINRFKQELNKPAP